MSLVLCPELGCEAQMEIRKDAEGPFYHCRNCGMDWDAEDMEQDPQPSDPSTKENDR